VGFFHGISPKRRFYQVKKVLPKQKQVLPSLFLAGTKRKFSGFLIFAVTRRKVTHSRPAGSEQTLEEGRK